jgi:hypothetical protein
VSSAIGERSYTPDCDDFGCNADQALNITAFLRPVHYGLTLRVSPLGGRDQGPSSLTDTRNAGAPVQEDRRQSECRNAGRRRLKGSADVPTREPSCSTMIIPARVPNPSWP